MSLDYGLGTMTAITYNLMDLIQIEILFEYNLDNMIVRSVKK